MGLGQAVSLQTSKSESPPTQSMAPDRFDRWGATGLSIWVSSGCPATHRAPVRNIGWSISAYQEGITVGDDSGRMDE